MEAILMQLKDFVTSASFTETVMNVIIALLMLVIGFWLVGKILNVFNKFLDGSSLGDELKPFLKSVVGTLLKVLVIFIVVEKVGIPTSSFVAALAAASFAVGMALQGSLSHIAAGILLLIFKQYKIGDFISIGDHKGFVEEIQIINTYIRTLENEIVIIPNGTAISDVIINSTGDDGYTRLEFMINMPYNESFDRVGKVILDALKETSNVISDPAPEVGISVFDTHFIQVAVRPYAKVKDYEQVFFDSTANVKKALGKAGVKMAYSEAVEFGEIAG